jgi:hypothetical protein
MKNKALVFMVLLAIPCLGWAKGQTQKSAANETPQAEPAEPAVSIWASSSAETAKAPPVDNSRQSGVPMQLVTRPMLEIIYNNGGDIKSIPYFISDSISLEYSKTTQNLEITENGEVILKEVTDQSRININRETAGTLVAVNYDGDGRMLLAMNFDENDGAYPLIFREGDSPLIFREGDKDRSFYLMHYVINGTERKVRYGEELYNLQIDDSIPRLQIQFEETVESRPAVRTLQGRKMQPRPTAGL